MTQMIPAGRWLALALTLQLAMALSLPHPALAGPRDAKHSKTGKEAPPEDPALAKYGIYRRTAPRAKTTSPTATRLPLALEKGDRVAFVGNALLERSRFFGYFEALLHQRFPAHGLVVRNLCWPADTPDLQPRPANFADLEQHLRHERTDVVFAAFGFNESFAGEAGLPQFRRALSSFVASLRAKAFNGETGARVVLLSPIANENIPGVAAADSNNSRLAAYAAVVRSVAREQSVGFADIFSPTRAAMEHAPSEKPGHLTFNGVHLTEEGYELLARVLYQEIFSEDAPAVKGALRQAIVEKNRQYFRRYRPVNSFYYVGDRNKAYGYLDFLPAMRNFDELVANRDRRIWGLAQEQAIPPTLDDSNLSPLPQTPQTRGANEWLSASEELESFQVDPRFEVNLFASEEEFPDIAAPIQIRWDSRGRLWVSCSTTYPHVYPGDEPRDKLVILEDTDGDGRADKSSVFADGLHIPLSFEFGDGGVYVSEQPHLSFLKDTDGDGKADFRRRVLSGFGCEDSHHSLHDFIWTPDGDLIFREGVFHHTQVETPYGPVRQGNSGWFRFNPRTHRLTSFGTYSSTNPWGVAFDRWGQHVASHPIYASAFHSLDPPYPEQHPRPIGLQGYSGTCGQDFVDFASFPDELQGSYVKARYKPTNRIEIHRWKEYEFGYEEEYVSDIVFSSNLSFIPVDIRFGPRGALYVCDWYNPIKGHMQYSLRDERRDRHSGRIWRITAKDRKLVDPPEFVGASVPQLLDILKRRESRYRYWARRELRERDATDVEQALSTWLGALSPDDAGFRHHQVEAIWTYRHIGKVNAELLRELLGCDERHARAAATRQLRYWHADLPDAIQLLRNAANDPSGLVRLEAAIAASYIGTKEALDVILDITKYPLGKHLSYALACSLGSHTLRRHWEGNSAYGHVPRLLTPSHMGKLVEPEPSEAEARFDRQKDLKLVEISCVRERMRYTVERFTARTGQPIKLVFSNPDETDHNLVIVQPGALEEVGMAANAMAKDPRHANSDFVPESKKSLILQYAPMIGPSRAERIHVLRFEAPKEPGIYPYVCTFPGHWVIMTGEMVVVKDLDDVDTLLATRGERQFVKNWTVADFGPEVKQLEGRSIMRGMKAFIKARCDQCHAIAGHGAKFGPDLTRVAEKHKGAQLLRQILEPSSEIADEYRTYQVIKKNGEILSGLVTRRDKEIVEVVPNLLTPDARVTMPREDVLRTVSSRVSSMPEGLVSGLTREEILDLLALLEAGGYKVPPGLRKGHEH